MKLAISFLKVDMANLKPLQSSSLKNLQVTLLLEILTSGQVLASVFEFPNCQVQASTKEAAIAKISDCIFRTAKKH